MWLLFLTTELKVINLPLYVLFLSPSFPFKIFIFYVVEFNAIVSHI